MGLAALLSRITNPEKELKINRRIAKGTEPESRGRLPDHLIIISHDQQEQFFHLVQIRSIGHSNIKRIRNIDCGAD